MSDQPIFQPASKDVTLILGCFNGGLELEANLHKLLGLLAALHRSYELIVVDDGSTDDSLATLQRMAQDVPELVVLRNEQNMGKGFSIRKGVFHARGKYIVFTDPDMTYAKENLVTVLEKLEQGSPMVVANRRLPESMYTVKNTLVRYVYRRHRTGLGFNFLVRKLFGLEHRDTQSGLKGFRREAALRVFETVHTHRYLFDVELFIRAKKLGFRVEEIPVHLTYETDYTTVKQVRYFFQLVPELVRIKSLELKGVYDAHAGDNRTTA